MPETRSTVGSAGGRDYATLAGWDASLPSDTSGTVYIADLYADSEFVSAGVILDLTGIVTTPLGPIIVRAADGESFVDNASIRTTALAYDAANGVAIRNTSGFAGLISCGSTTNIIFERIQFKGDDGSHYDFISSNFSSSGLIRINQCLFYGRNEFVGLRNPQRVYDSVLLRYGTGTPSRMVNVQANFGYAEWANCTLFAASDAGSPAAGFAHNFVTLLAKNVAVFGCTNVENAGGGTFTATTGATDDTTPPTGFTGSLTFADQFEVVTTSGIDARVKSGADLIDAGTTLTPDTQPVVWGTADGSQNTNATSHTITLPTHAAGELLVVVFSVDGNPTVSVNTGSSSADWNKLGQASNSTVVTQAIFWKVATSASETLVLDTTASEQSTHISYVITSYLPAATFYVTGTSANGSSTNSDPPAETPAYGRSDYLWIATRGGDSTVQATAAPANFSPLRTRTASGTNGASTATAENYAAFATTVNPGTWTSATEQWVCWTLGIRAVMAFDDISGTAFSSGGGPDIGAWEYSSGTAITGSGAITFADMAVDGTGVEEIPGSGAITFGAMTTAGSGELGLSGSGALTFAPMTTAGSGTLAFVGSGAITFGAMATSGAGLLGIAGAGALTFAPMGVSGSGAVAVAGSGVLTFAPMTVSGVGYLPITGAGALTFGPMTIAGVGAVSTTLIEGSGAIVFDAMSISGVGLNSAPGPTPAPAPVRRRPALSAIPLPTTPWVIPLTGNLTPVAYQFLFTLMRRTGGQPGKTTPDDQDALPLASLLEGGGEWANVSQRFEFAGDTQTQTLVSLAETERLDASSVQVVLSDGQVEPPAQIVILGVEGGAITDAALLPIATPQSAPLPDVLTPGASPWTFDAPGKGFVLVEGGTVSAITISRDGTTNYATGMTGGFFPVDWQDQLTVTYTVAPNVTFFGSSFDA